MEMSYNIFIALALGVLVFALGAVLSKQLPLLVGVLIWVMSVLAGGYVLLKEVREYDSAIEALDQLLQNLAKGQPAPSLAELT